MSLFRKKKTVEQSMKELFALGTADNPFQNIYTAQKAEWLPPCEWTKDSAINLFCGEELWPHVQFSYDQNKQLKEMRANKSDLKKENEKLKKKVAELTAEVERLTKPTGRKIIVEHKKETV